MPGLTEEWDRVMGRIELEAISTKQSQQGVFVGREATIVNGACAGIAGIVVYANSVEDSVIIKADKDTYIAVAFENISIV